MTDREEAGLRGPVYTCAMEHSCLYPDHQWVLNSSEMFSQDGKLLERRHRNPDGSHGLTVCRYGDDGRLLEKRRSGSSPDIDEAFLHHYDALGRLERVVLHRAGEDERVIESVLYAADGTRTETCYSTPPAGANVGVLVTSMLHISLDTAAAMTMFDAAGRAVRKVLYDDERVIRRILFRYDDRGQLMEEGEVIAGQISEHFRNRYCYDAAGRRVEVDQHYGDWGGQRTGFAYNEYGDVIEERVEQRRLPIGEPETASWSQHYTHRYDPRGNWIERTSELVRSSGEITVSTVERREITYY